MIYTGGGSVSDVKKRRAEPQLLQAQPYHNRSIPELASAKRHSRLRRAPSLGQYLSQPHYVGWDVRMSGTLLYPPSLGISRAAFILAATTH